MADNRYNLRSSTIIVKPRHREGTFPTVTRASRRFSPKPARAIHRYYLRSSGQNGPFNLMGLPAELRQTIYSRVFSHAVSPRGAISISPRAHSFQLRKDATNWQKRRGILHASHQLREEALDVLYRENIFFAHMSIPGRPDHDTDPFDRLRFKRWLKAGGDVEAKRIRKVHFAVAWHAVRTANGKWNRRRAEVELCVSQPHGMKVQVCGPIASDLVQPERPTERREDVEQILATMLQKARVEHLDCKGWMAVWDMVASALRNL